jgi:beta-lactamase regulating signal transducer with metallopeptidase domain
MYSILSGLINGAILATALTATVWIALRLTPRSSLNAATRYVIWWVVLFAAVLIPITPAPHLPSSFLRKVPRTITPTATVVPAYIPAPPSPPRYVALPIQVPSSAPWPRWPLLLWPALSLFLMVRLAASLILLNRLKARAQPPPLTLIPRIAQWLAHCEGHRGGIRIALSREIATPIATGPRRPTILLPAHLVEDLSEEDLDRIGLHETAHLVRRDDYALIAQRILEALFIPWPLVWWIARRIDLEREIACDDLVIAALGRPRSYAACLTRIVESRATPGSSWPAAAATEDASQLARRVDALLDKTRRAGAHLMKAPLAAITAALLCLVLLTGRAPALIAFVATTANHAARFIPTRAAALLPLQAASNQPRAAAAEITGQVVEDNTGHPVASAELRFHKQGLRELAADLETDRQGRFSAEGLPSGEYSIDVLKPNYVATKFRLAVPAPYVAVRLVHYGVIDGQATDAAGEPLSGIIRAPGGRTIGSARITVLTKDPVSGQLNSIREVTLESGGRYRIFDLPPGQYAVGLWYSGQNEGSGMQLYPDNAHPRFFTIAGGEEYDGVNFVVAPHPASQISGTVQLPEGVTGQFQLALGLPEQPTLAVAQVLSEKDGTFRFEKIPPGSYELFAAGPVGGYGGFASVLGAGKALFGRTRVQTSGQNIEGLSLPLTEARSLRVLLRARGSDRPPEGCPAGAKIALTPLEPWTILYFPGADAAFGKELVISNLAPGRFRVAATDLGNGCFQTNDAVIDLSAEQHDPVALELSSAGSIQGTLRGGSPGSVVSLKDVRAAGDPQARAAYPDAAGHFAFEGLLPSRYRISVRPANQKSDPPQGKEVEVTGGAATEVEITQ